LKKQLECEFVEGGADLLDHIEPLWEQLNALHAEKSTYFPETFTRTSFPDRKQGLQDKAINGKLLTILARIREGEFVGYCVCSVCDEHSGKVGEIDSMFILAAYRRLGIGRAFLERSMNWFEGNGAKNVIAFVGVGNEEVLEFYKTFGLLPRAIRLELKTRARASGR
jgi:diamine N-acetyltransferase